MVKFLQIFLLIALYVPAILWGSYVSHSGGRNSFSEALWWEQAVAACLVVIPMLIIVNWKKVSE
jgi:hypothetical protein